MEKGSFQTSKPKSIESNSVHETDRLVQTLPLPDEIPQRRLDFKELPAEAMRSGAIDSLLSQNEDLMARLGVSVRRASFLEDKISKIENENRQLRHRFESLKEQMMVVSEKERMLQQRSFGAAHEATVLREKLEIMERTYAEIYSTAQGQSRRIERFLKYRSKIVKITRETQARAKRLDQLLRKEEDRSAEFEMQLEETHRQLTALRKESSESQMQAINHFEAKVADLHAEVELLRGKCQDRDDLLQEKTRLENELVFIDRQNRNYRESSQDEIETLRKEKQQLSIQTKQQLIDLERTCKSLETAEQALSQSKQSETELFNQVESLQLLWREKQDELERSEEKNKALQKLNQQLSVTINQYRREIGELKSAMEKAEYNHEQRIDGFRALLKERGEG